MKRILTLSLLLIGCSERVETPLSPSSIELLPSHQRLEEGNSCPDSAPKWLTANSSTDRSSFTAEFTGFPNVDTYDVEVSYSRDGIDPIPLYIKRSNRTEYRLASVSGGRYYLRARTKNRCDVEGQWSDTLTVYMEKELIDIKLGVECKYCHNSYHFRGDDPFHF